MTFRFNYKRIIALLTVGLIILGGILWYREQATNKEAPKRAKFVFHILEGGKICE